MFLLKQHHVDAYAKAILKILDESEVYPDILAKSHGWLLSSPPKRAVYHLLYNSFLCGKTDRKLLDVGGGYSSLSRVLAKNTAYYGLIDPLHVRSSITFHKINIDWYQYSPTVYDTVIANDLFPNVDQRLEIFLDKYLKVCHRMILSLTFYNNPRFYETKRIDGDERLYFLAYNGEQLERILCKYKANILDADFSILNSKGTVFPNGRQVCIITFEGDI